MSKNRSNGNSSNMTDKRELLAKLSNRANTRLRAQEKNGIQNDAYYTALEHINELGGMGTRFSRSKKLDDNVIEQQLLYVRQYLSDETSTMRGFKKANELDFFHTYTANEMSKMSRKELEQAYQRQAKRANTNIKNLEKAGYGDDKRAMARAKYFLQDKDRNLTKYPTTKKDINNMSDKDLRLFLQNASKFNNYKTSTVGGIEMQNEQQQIALKKMGIDIPLEYTQDFFNFLSSQTGKELKKNGDSNQYLEKFQEALEIGYTVEQIKNMTNDFLTDNSMTFDLYLERFNEKPNFK